jgi:UDP-2,4-diacetamido-2,4,6-trideoxy-beta-L-altropyranose hydrolase
MNRQKSVFGIRCISETGKGYGNFNRCLTVANSLQTQKQNIIFFINKNSIVEKQLLKKKINYIIVPKFLSKQKESFFILKKCEIINCKILLIDMREYGEILSKYFYNNIFTILFDDAWCKNAYANIIFNGTNVKKYHEYKLKNLRSKLFLGSKYWISNKNFLSSRKSKHKIINKKIYSIIISMGGSDPKNFSLFILKSLLDIKNIKIKIILGPFNKNKKSILKIIENRNNINLIISPEKIWNEFSNSDLVICNAGNTLFELAILGIPSISIPAFKHEVEYSREFEKNKFSINLEKPTSRKIQLFVEKILKNSKYRRSASQCGKKIVDGKGLSRVLKIITQYSEIESRKTHIQ